MSTTVTTKVHFEKEDDVVRVCWKCGSDYMAQVFFEDLVDHFNRGNRISFVKNDGRKPQKTI